MAAGDVDAVRSRIDIVELVSETVPLKKAGRQFSAPCPFHTEKTPSFYVDPARQTWRCFGACATGGDVFSFLMKRDHLEFGEALRALAERAGITLSRGRAPEEQERHERLYAASEAAVLFFRNALLAGELGRAARAYAERRGLDAATLERFEIGFAPEGWDHLRGYLHGKGFADEELIEAGLLTQGERGAYDRFRGRLMFPIRDEKGRAVGFGGRALGDEKPKYLNTPQTAVFDKGSLLFLLDRAKESIRKADEAVLVEGYLDAITAHQFGYTNVVATLGTALTERHVTLLKRFTRRVTLAMDADAAGIQAAVRGEEVARTAASDEGDAEVVVSWDALVRVQARAPIQVRVFTVPSGKDPDEAIREDPQGWPAWVAAAVPPFEFRLRYELAHTDMADPRARVEVADRMMPLLLQISDAAEQASYVRDVANAVGVNPDRMAERVRATAQRKGGNALGKVLPLRARVTAPPAEQRGAAEQPDSPGAEDTGRAAPAPRRDNRIERTALALLLRFPTLREAGEALDAGIFEQTALRELFERWRRDSASLPAGLPQELEAAYAAVMAERLPPYDATAAEQALLEMLEKLRRAQLTERKRLLQAELAELQAQIDQGAAAALAATLLAGQDGASEIPETVLAAVSRQRDDEYLMREIHALEWELRTHRAAPWLQRERRAAESGGRARDVANPQRSGASAGTNNEV